MPNPMNDFAEQYDRWFESDEGRGIFKVELRCIQDLIGVGIGRWLEIGVGTGRFAAALGITEGVDPSQAALEIAKQRGIATLTGRAEQLPYEDSVFDGVLMVTTFCFLPHPRQALKEVHRILSPGGMFVLGMIPADSAWGKAYAEKGKAGHVFYSTASFYTCADVIALAGEAGLVLVDARSCLVNGPDEAPSPHVQSGISSIAGFVCLKFLAADTTAQGDDAAIPNQ
jgi:ubiquinone/menaquinone biosynthesis C-methylase UbiE